MSEHSILDKECDEYFGFLENEIKETLKYYEVYFLNLMKFILGIMDINSEK